MKHRTFSVLGTVLVGATLVALQGCGTKWVMSGEEGAVAKQGSQGQGSGSAGQAGRNGSGGIMGQSGSITGQSSSMDSPHGSASSGNGMADGGQGSDYPSLSWNRGAGNQRLRGFDPLVEGQVAAEERLKQDDLIAQVERSGYGERTFEQMTQEEKAAVRAGLKDIFFGYDQWTISEQASEALEHNAAWLKENPNAFLRIEGHCDERGTQDYNLVLGEKRAKAARAYLTDMGITSKQVGIVSYGKTRPFCSESSEACYQKNRRDHMLLRMQ